MKTFVPKKDEVARTWWLVDAEGKILGRLATEVAVLLRGKNKPQFSTFLDTVFASGDLRVYAVPQYQVVPTS